jgi:hypothetical protein
VHGNQNWKLEGVGLLMEQDFVLANFSGGSENCILESGVHTRSLANKQVQLMVPNSSSTHPRFFSRYLELSLSGNITLEYIPYVWESINHLVGIRTGFHFLRLNWERVYSTYEDVYLVLNAICQDFLAYLSTEIDLQDVSTTPNLDYLLSECVLVDTILQAASERFEVCGPADAGVSRRNQDQDQLERKTLKFRRGVADERKCRLKKILCKQLRTL